MQTHLENDILVVLVAQHVFALGCILCLLAVVGLLLGLESRRLLDGRISLLLARHLLQAVELFSVQLVELRVDVLDGVFCAWDDDVLTAGD